MAERSEEGREPQCISWGSSVVGNRSQNGATALANFVRRSTIAALDKRRGEEPKDPPRLFSAFLTIRFEGFWAMPRPSRSERPWPKTRVTHLVPFRNARTRPSWSFQRRRAAILSARKVAK